MTSPTTARDVMQSTIETALAADPITTGIIRQFDNFKVDPPEGVDAEGRAVPYIRTTVRHAGGTQETLGNVGNRRYDSTGVLTVQIFTAPGDGHALSDTIVPIVRTAMQALRSANGVWLGEISPPIEIGITGAWFQVNVTAAFTYEEVA
tara:strand:+ start:20063 stop:20509 length:447 start_codon:yes stop_codon:yes gene_type:complete